jgi:EmrB/QacA subfamily drug resistance transporter
MTDSSEITREPIPPPSWDAATLRWTLVTMTMATGLYFLSGSVVSVALPAIGRSLDAGLAGLQWTVNGYFLTLSVLLIPAGALGDRYGRRRAILIGMTLFGVMALVAGVAPTIEWLIGARLVQGGGAAFLVPAPLATLRAVHTRAEDRGAAIGYWSGWSGVTLIVGPLLGGWLVDRFSWRWAFFFQVPLIAVAIWLIIRHVPETREGVRGRLDWAGAALAGLGFGGLLLWLVQGPEWGWRNPMTWGSLLIGAAGIGLFILVESRVSNPMVPLRLFRLGNFSGANLNTFAVYGALEALLFFLILYVQSVMGVSALISGLLFVPISAILLFLSPFFGRLAGRHGARRLLTLGPFLSGGGILLLLGLQPESNFWLGTMPGVVLFSLGLAAMVAPLTNTIMSSVDSRYGGLAAAFNQVVARVAGLVAIAGLGIVLSWTFNTALDGYLAGSLSVPPASPLSKERVDPNAAIGALEDLPLEAREAVRSSYTEAFYRVMLINALLIMAGGVVAWVMIRDRGAPDALRGDEPT